MQPYHLAVDIGASSGRCVLGRLADGQIQTEEIRRFPNGFVSRGGSLVWPLDSLCAEIVAALKDCAALGKPPASVGIDAWAVDFMLLDDAGRPMGDCVAYRDKRTDGMDAQVYAQIPEAELYARTGIQRAAFNTVFQLQAVKPALAAASRLLMVPDYLNYRLCGAMANEYTNATTTGLMNAAARDWDGGVLSALGYPPRLFAKPVMPGARLGRVRANIGYDCQVLAVASHDTASAVMAVTRQDAAYISSGTWSLMGTGLDAPNASEAARLANFTNEGGYGGTFRFLKNICGLWLVQSISREAGGCLSFAELCGMAEAADNDSIIDCNHPRFVAPENMSAEIRAACGESGQRPPETTGELARVAYRSLAACYAETLNELERLTGRSYPAVQIVGGGANADYLNRLTAQATRRPVLAGPAEATAIGNLTSQMIAYGEFDNISRAGERVAQSFPLKEYLP